MTLGGCNFVVLDPAGDIAVQQRNLILIATGLMLLVIIPVMAMTVLFAWRYRERNTEAVYEPDWDHSTKIELGVWAVPLLSIIVLGAFTWVGTHLLDPYRPLGRIDPITPVVFDQHRPLDVEVVAMDWKWLFILPEYGVAAVNDLAAPVDRPISFRITSTTVMNALYIPALAGMIYAMPGMETKLHAVINQPGEYVGFSANYSGAGFSEMRFPFHGLDDAGFDAWVAKAKASGQALDRATYQAMVAPTIAAPVSLYGTVDATLFGAIVDQCVTPGASCLRDPVPPNARDGGLGIEFARLGDAAWPSDTAALCGPVPAAGPKIRDRFTRMVGLGLPRPGAPPPASPPAPPVQTSALPPQLSDL